MKKHTILVLNRYFLPFSGGELIRFILQILLLFVFIYFGFVLDRIAFGFMAIINLGMILLILNRRFFQPIETGLTAERNWEILQKIAENNEKITLYELEKALDMKFENAYSGQEILVALAKERFIYVNNRYSKTLLPLIRSYHLKNFKQLIQLKIAEIKSLKA